MATPKDSAPAHPSTEETLAKLENAVAKLLALVVGHQRVGEPLLELRRHLGAVLPGGRTATVGCAKGA